MESFQLWDLDEIKLVLEGENFAAGVVEVLRSFVIFKGIEKYWQNLAMCNSKLEFLILCF